MSTKIRPVTEAQARALRIQAFEVEQARIEQGVMKAKAVVSAGRDPLVDFSFVTPKDDPPFTRIRNRSFWMVQAKAIDLLYWAWQRARRGNKGDMDRRFRQSLEFAQAWGLASGFLACAKGLTHLPGRWTRFTLPSGERVCFEEWFLQMEAVASQLTRPYILYCSHCGTSFWGKKAEVKSCPMCGRTKELMNLKE